MFSVVFFANLQKLPYNVCRYGNAGNGGALNKKTRYWAV